MDNVAEKEFIDPKELNHLRKKLAYEQRQIKWRKFISNKASVVGLIITITLTLLAIFAPLIVKTDPLAMNVDERLLGVSTTHIFGTDTFGRDLFSRVVYGTRVSMSVGLAVSGIVLVVGMFIGLYASYYKTLGMIFMRICDGMMAIPGILLAITFMAVLGASTRNVIISLSIVYIPAIARITRSSALVVREQTYIEAMQALGASPSRIIWRHIAPNVLSPVIVQITFIFANAIVVEAALSFLGAGVPAPAPSWGNILYEGKNVIYNAWWMVLYPGLFTALSVLGLNLFGDGLRDILDPLAN